MIDLALNFVQRSIETTWEFVRDNTIIGVMLVALGPTAVEAMDGHSQPEADQAEIQLETFDQVWDQVRTQYFDYERIEADWITTREELRPQAASASTTELRSLLNRMLEGVGESHFNVLPPTGVPASEDGDGASAEAPNLSTGLGVRLIDGALIVDRVGEANEDLIEPGWELTAIGEQSLTELIEDTLETEEQEARERAELILEASANGRIGFPQQGEELVLTLRNAEGEERQVTARTGDEEVSIVRIGNLPGLPFSYQATVVGDGDECVGSLRFTTWVPDLMDRFMASRDELFACQGLVIDLRGNLGGVLTTMMPLTSHLVSEPVLLGQLMRADGRIDFRSFPRRVADDGTRLTPFDGPVAILIDSLSASTSEMFTSGMQALGRARVFGTHSPGMALPANMLPLANGDRLMYAFADYIDGEGRRIEGVGVQPDEVITADRDAILAGGDPVFQAAVAWLRNPTAEENAQ
ncbi:MAG: S41 family peptidase [Pseudomonadota bacterium]